MTDSLNKQNGPVSALGRLIGYITWPFVTLANFTRHLILLLIFLLIVWFFFGGTSIVLKPNTALVLAPKGFIVEQYSGNASSRAMRKLQNADIPETRVRDVLATIRHAATDPRITALVLNPDYMWGAGLANLREIERAIDDFRTQSGKPVIAMATSLSQTQYYFANMADDILMDPQGFLFLQGIGSYRNYFKSALDKLGVDAHLFKVGEYKSAAEPFVRDDMSQEAKDAGLHFMNDLWDTYLQGIAKRRDISIDDLQLIISEQGKRLQEKKGNVAAMAVEAGLVDRIMKRPFMEKLIAEKTAFNEDGDSFRQISFENYLNFVNQDKSENNSKRVAVVVAEGTIVGGTQPPGTIGGVSTSALLERARLDESVKAVVLRVNSPGGGVFASEQIRRQVDALKAAGKPTVVSMGNVAASGGYWISMTSDAIWADEATITGSIGIYGLLLTYPKLFEKLGISTDGVGTTKWVGAFNPDRDLNPEFAELIQSNVEFGYQQFISSVAAARGLEVNMVDRIARGRVWTAKQAHDLGLIDQLGGLQQAIDDAAQRANLKENYNITYIEPQPSLSEQLLMKAVSKVSDGLNLQFEADEMSVLNTLMQPYKNEIKLLMSAMNGQNNQFAYCFCNINSL
ncbi:signal peptide peptidase SppA [Marinicella sp. W31]|uniref:signal peptide peptidase SppA n=1 Tax=Marinicella sp. W31 TaxID=3023713 RepID=UPI003756B475